MTLTVDPEIVGAPEPDASAGSRDHGRAARVLRWWSGPLALFVPMLAWFAAFRPAIMTADSLDIWSKSGQGRIIDGGSPLYNSLAWASRQLTGSPSALVLAQMLFLAIALATLVRAVVSLGAPRAPLWIIAVLAACSPPVGGYSLAFWKDVPYAASLVLFTAVLVRLIGARRDGAYRPVDLGVLYAASLAAILFRQNGAIVVVGAGTIAVILIGRGLRKPLTIALLAALLGAGFVRTVGYEVAGVEPAADWLPVAWMANDIGGVYRNTPEIFEPDDLELMESMLPLHLWAEGSNCYTLDFLVYRRPMDVEILGQRRSEIVALWREVFAESTRRVISQHVCGASIAWRPWSVHDGVSVMYTLSAGIDPNNQRLETRPILGGLREVGLDLLRLWDDRDWQWVSWRAATYIYPTYLVAVVLAVRRRSLIWLLPAAPMLAQQANLFIVNPAQDARYMIASVHAAYVLIPGFLLLALRRSSPDSHPEERTLSDLSRSNS